MWQVDAQEVNNILLLWHRYESSYVDQQMLIKIDRKLWNLMEITDVFFYCKSELDILWQPSVFS